MDSISRNGVLPRPHGPPRAGGGSPMARGRGGSCTVYTLPLFIATWNSVPWPGTRTGRVRAWPITSPASLRMITSRGWGCWSSATWCTSQPAASVSTATPTTTASQMRTYRGTRSITVVDSILLLGEHVADAAHGEDALGVLHVVLDRRPDAAHVDVDRAVERLE